MPKPGWRIQYDEFVRRNCKERRLIYPTIGSAEHVQFKGKMPRNAGMLKHVLDRVYAGDIEKEHGHYLSEHVFKVSNKGIHHMTGFGNHFNDDSDNDDDNDDHGSVTDYDIESEGEQILEMEGVFDNLRQGRSIPSQRRTHTFLSDSDKEEEDFFTPPVASRTRSRTRAPRYGETGFPTDMFGSPLGNY